MVAPRIVEQRSTFLPIGVENFAKDDGVVARRNGLARRTFEPGECSAQKRHTGLTRVPVDTAEAIEAALGEAHGDRFLVLGEHVNAKMARLFEMTKDVGTMVDANQNERRFHGYACK